MIPHPETVCMLGTLEFQERLRDAARGRLAASADTGERSRVGVAWLGGVLSRLRGASQGWVARPLTTGAARPALRVI
jgi:hypothetical protein